MKRELLFSLFALNAWAIDWRPISKEELDLKASALDKNADAEVLFWEQRIYDGMRGGNAEHHEEHYLRVKIFNDRGVKRHSTVDVPYSTRNKMTIARLRGRTIKPDGTIVEMKNDAVFDKTDVKIGRRTMLKTRSFTLPAVEPGVIVEYQWDEVTSEGYYLRVDIELQKSIPVRKVDVLLMPLDVERTGGRRMFPYPFNCQITPFEEVKVPQVFFKTSVQNIPAFIDEPDAPSDPQLKQWLMIHYSSNEQKDPKKFWPKMGRDLEGDFKRELKINGDVKAMAAEAAAGASTPEEKAVKIADYVRTKLKNFFYETAAITAEDRSNYKRKEGYNSGDTAKQKLGLPSDLNTLFVAMAQAAGLEARGVNAGSAETAYFRPDFFAKHLLPKEIAAIKLGGQWKFFDVTNPYIPAGMVDAEQEGMAAIVLDEKDPPLLVIPPSPPDNTQEQRTAKLTLNEDGSLEGTVSMALTGHRSVAAKTLMARLSEAKREENLRAQLRALHGEAEVTDIKIENVLDPLQPLVYRYKLKVANYAERTGKRLFFQPNFFTHGAKPRFTNTERKHPIMFPYAFTEGDSVDITMPEGYKLEAAESPGNLKLAAVGDHNISIGVRGNTLVFRRTLVWGKQGAILFEPQHYKAVKGAWDEIHRRDQHSLTLRAAQ